MTLNIGLAENHDLQPRITVVGVGGAGGNAVNNMIEKALEGAEFVVANTDSQALQQSRADLRIQLGARVTEGLGAGARPEIGKAAAEESINEIAEYLQGRHMCFVTAGMGGGTGTGAAPVIAQAAREMGVLTVGVVTKPFTFEGSKRMRQAEAGIEALQRHVDTLIIIPNQNLFRLATENTTFTEAFMLADDVLYQGVKGVTDLIVRPGLMNLDFADIRTVMDEMGKAMMGAGEAEGEGRARQAAELAVSNPLLDEVSLKGAKGVLINVTAGRDLTLFELDEASNYIREQVDENANIIVGSTLDPEMEGRIRVSLVATGIDAEPQSGSERPAVGGYNQAAIARQEPKPEVAAPVQPTPRYEQPTPQRQPEFAEEPREPRYNPEPVQRAEPEPQQPAEPQAPRSTFIDQQAAGLSPRPVQQQPTPEPRAEEPQTPAQPAAPQRSHNPINSLIERMSHGRNAQAASGLTGGTAGAKSGPAPKDEDDSQDEQMEIPAFLRRQAN
ncbi:cell division protein FtsZ [Paracoccaceae bacterium GXU_MW_L88]